MDLDALLHPRGPLPAGVYWRRRLVLLAVLAVVLWLLQRIATGGGADDRLGIGPSPSPSPSESPSTSPSPQPSPQSSRSPSPSRSPSRSPGGACRTSDLKVEATTNATSYSAAQQPVLTLAVTNIGPVACTRDLGQAARELRVRSGGDRIWSSDDCAPGGAAQPVLLQPKERRAFSVTWSRRRSAPGCPAERQEAAPGTYQVIGRLGDITVTGSAFRLA